jgi:4-hydroxy-3-polyprenylbenzoate decarboxylase
MQVFGKNLTGMHWHKHKVGARHYTEYKKLNRKMPVAVILGGDPVYTYCATAPLPDNVDEYLLAGYLRQKPVKLVKCITQDIEVPADADIVIEGYIDPQEDLIFEGPFGDHTGFYSLPDYYPRFHITCITHRKNAVYPATLVGVPPQEDAYIAKATERIFLPLLQKSIAPEIIDFNLPEAGVAHNFTIVKIKNQYEGHAQKVMNAFWGNGQMSLNKCLFITDDEKINIEDYEEFARKVLKNFNPKQDIFYTKGPIDVLDHAAEKFTYGSKIGFDFTQKFKQTSSVSVFQDVDIQSFVANFDEITDFYSLLEKQIPILILAIQKKEKIATFFEKFIKKIDVIPFKIIIFVDNDINIQNLYITAWITGNNIDPMRDTFIVEDNKKQSCLIVDATKKTKEIDNFQREWPEITIMNDEIIKKIDKNWDKLKIGNFVESPSLMFKKSK